MPNTNMFIYNNHDIIMDVHKNTRLEIVSGDTPSDNIDTYEWYLNGIKLRESTKTIIIDAWKLQPGENTISLKVKNQCGNWSGLYSKTINILEEIKMEKTITILVDQPVVSTTIVMDFTGTNEVIVTDQLNRPIAGASLDLDGTPTGLTTGTDGKASILNVPYGTHTVKAVKV